MVLVGHVTIVNFLFQICKHNATIKIAADMKLGANEIITKTTFFENFRTPNITFQTWMFYIIEDIYTLINSFDLSKEHKNVCDDWDFDLWNIETY